MADEFIMPNWHVALIHYPIALLTLGVLVELLSFLWRRGGFRAAGRWMILLGALLAIPALTAGIYALRKEMVSGPVEIDQRWSELAAENHWPAEQWELL